MKALRRAAFGLLLLGAVAFLCLVGSNAYARYRARKAERAWVRSFGTLPDLLRRYPKTSTNETARRLEILAGSLGVDLTEKTHDSLTAETVSSTKLPENEAELLRHGVSVYLTSQVEKPEAAIDPPPPAVKGFLAAHATDLYALEAELLASPPPHWRFDPADLPGRQPIPDVYSLIRLQRALLAGALAEAAGENAAAAGRALEASWRLNQTLREMPDVSCQLVALAIARLQLGAMRKVDVDASLWRMRLADHDFKRSVVDTELLALWPNSEKYRRLEEIELRSQRNLLKRLKTLFERPYEDIVWAEVTDGMRLEYVRIRESPLSDQEAPDGPKNSSAEISRSIFLPNLLNAFRRADSFLLDSELTDKVLQARELRKQSGLEWPTAIPGIERTQLPGARWIYSVSPRGTMNLSLSREPIWNHGGLVLPLCFTSS